MYIHYSSCVYGCFHANPERQKKKKHVLSWRELNLHPPSLWSSSPPLFQDRVASICFVTVIPSFLFASEILPFRHQVLAKCQNLGFCVFCFKWREPAERNVNQRKKSIMEAIYEVCEEWQHSPGTLAHAHTHTDALKDTDTSTHTHTRMHRHTTCSIFCNRGKWIRFWCFKSFFFRLLLKVNFPLMARCLCLQATDDWERRRDRKEGGQRREKGGWIINGF